MVRTASSKQPNIISSDQKPHTENAQTVPNQRRDPKSNATTGASAAGARTIGSQIIAFYFRAPVKAFFRNRVDYLSFARAINPRVQAKESWSWRLSTPGLLTYAVREHGWSFIPNQVLPPMLANIGVGAILYTSYLQILGSLYQPSSQSLKRTYPPPPIYSTCAAGFMAGTIQSVVAAPIDALQVRFRTSDVLDGKYKNMWQYGRGKLAEIGVKGVFAGWGLSFIKDSMGYAAFFATFEYVKAQSYYAFITKYYGGLSPYSGPVLHADSDNAGIPLIRPHYAIEPTFLMLAGVSASITQQAIYHPITLLQEIHHNSLSKLDRHAKFSHTTSQILRNYYSTYEATYRRCLVYVRRFGGWRKWLYRGFFLNTIKQVPGTSAGLVIFELVRRRYGSEAEAVRIEKDGYYILFS